MPEHTNGPFCVHIIMLPLYVCPDSPVIERLFSCVINLLTQVSVGRLGKGGSQRRRPRFLSLYPISVFGRSVFAAVALLSGQRLGSC